MSKATQIREYMKANPTATPDEVAKALGVKRAYVHSIKFLDKKAKAPAKKRGRPAKVVPKFEGIIESLPKELITPPDYRQMILKSEIDGLKKEVDELTVIIAYLEHRLHKAEARYGVAV